MVAKVGVSLAWMDLISKYQSSFGEVKESAENEKAGGALAAIGSPTYFHIQSGTSSCIDLSFCDPGTAPLLQWQTLDSLYDSNHYPILFSSDIPENSEVIHKWKIAQANWRLFSDTLEDLSNQIIFKENIDAAVEQFTNCILTAANQCIDTPPAQVWTKIKQMRGLKTYRKISAITDGDNIITNDNQITETLAKYFQNKTKSELSISYPTNHSPPNPIQTNPINLAFTEVELKLAISSIKNSSAGPDDIPSIFLKHLQAGTLLKLLALYNKIWFSQSFPSLWRQSLIIPIKKNDSSSNFASAYRPISLTCTMCKLLEKMINKRLLWFLEENNLIDAAQSGFRPNRSTMDNLVLLHTEITQAISNKNEVITVALDLESAFDTINRAVIIRKLEQLNLTGKVTRSTCSLLQNTLNNLHNWSTKIGVKFSSGKSKVINFSRRYHTHPPLLHLNGSPLQVVDKHKFLGVIFDKRLTWRDQIQNTKTNCLNRINILKTLAHHQWGAEEKVLLRIYRTLIRSRLDYGSILYISASDTHLKSLNTIHNTSLCISLGAFKSSPSESLYIESSEPPLFIRRQRLLLSYFSRISANPKNPVIKLINTPHSVPDNSHPRAHSLSQILKSLLKDTDLKLTTPFTTSRISPWTKKLPTVLTSLNRYKKEETPRTLLVQAFKELIQTQRYDKILYTDASKEKQAVGCAVSTSNTTVASYRLSPRCSIHTAELYGILKALDSPITNEKSLAICTDSLSAIDSIRNIYSIHPIVQCIHSICQEQSKNGVSEKVLQFYELMKQLEPPTSTFQADKELLASKD
ncbi:uncharacterized protein [Diabrotica undecimpunctata]|uniref:uncharacterized protein n=1 Tax=Diabrotica undecimpunctata TaxID=50387 RepID=UPI003B632050